MGTHSQTKNNNVTTATYHITRPPWIVVVVLLFRQLLPYIMYQAIRYLNSLLDAINLTHYHIFRGCVPEMFVTSYSVTYCIYIPGKPGFCFHYYCADYHECKHSDTFGLADRVRLLYITPSHYHNCAKFIWGHWTYEMPVRYILSSVWVRSNIFSQLSIIQYMGLCVFSLPISLVMIDRIYTLSYYHYQIGSMNYCPL